MENWKAENARTAKDQLAKRLYLKGCERVGIRGTRGRWIKAGLMPYEIQTSYSALTSSLYSLGQNA